MTPRHEPHVHVGEPHVEAMNRTSTCVNRTSVSGEGRSGLKSFSVKISEIIPW